MENKSITQENLTDERDRIREAARALVEEHRRKHDARAMSEATVATYDRASRQTMFTPEGKSFFRRSEDYRKKASPDTGVHPQQIESPRFPGVRIRLVEGAPYYIN